MQKPSESVDCREAHREPRQRPKYGRWSEWAFHQRRYLSIFFKSNSGKLFLQDFLENRPGRVGSLSGPPAVSVVRSRQMSLIRSRGNKSTQQAIVGLLRTHPVTGWRRHRVVSVIGADGACLKVRPDFFFVACRVAVFLAGYFWHGCSRHCRLPKTRQKFWTEKIHRNMKRDKVVSSALRKNGWTTIRLWEHDIKSPSSGRVWRTLQAIVERCR